MRTASMRQLALLRGTSSRPFLGSFGKPPTFRRQVRENAVNRNALTTCALRRPTRASEHVLLFCGGKTAIPAAQRCRPFGSSTSTGEEGDGQEDTGSYSEADHEHAVISAFDLLYVESNLSCSSATCHLPQSLCNMQVPRKKRKSEC